MPAYTTKVAIENYLLRNIDVSFDTQITEWIQVVSQFIDQYCNRTFVADAQASARLFESGKAAKLLIDDAIEITTVEKGDKYGESFTATTAYVALPLNGTPKTAIGIKNEAWPVGIHRITAKWGYQATVPVDIKFAATVLAAGIVNTQVKTGIAKKRERIGNYEATYTDDNGINDYQRVLSILDSYKKLAL